MSKIPIWLNSEDTAISKVLGLLALLEDLEVAREEDSNFETICKAEFICKKAGTVRTFKAVAEDKLLDIVDFLSFLGILNDDTLYNAYARMGKHKLVEKAPDSLVKE